MNKKTLENALNKYGGNLNKWPEDLRLKAVRIFTLDEEVKNKLIEIQEFEKSMRRYFVTPKVSNRLKSRIMLMIKQGSSN